VCTTTAVLAACGCGSTATSSSRIFDRSCGHCHTLTGHDTNATGGDLGLGTLTVAQIASFTRVMPTHPALTATQIDVVARYVAQGEQH
jgi:mono/diheme cytochrome c family protein